MADNQSCSKSEPSSKKPIIAMIRASASSMSALRQLFEALPGQKTMITRLKKSTTKVNRIGSAQSKRSTRDVSAEVRSRRILATILALRDGNFSVRLPSDWDGIDGQIAAAINQVVSHEERLSREVERLSRIVGREGRLQQRMSIPGAIGGWADKDECFNS